MMSILGIDLGGTKLATALFSESGETISKNTIALGDLSGAEVGALIALQVRKYLLSHGTALKSIGISVPGISRYQTGTVWAPNIEGWVDYPLRDEISSISEGIPVSIDSDRACCILGEQWMGNIKDCTDAICLTVGTGIGAGILADGNILRGADDIAGSVGWMALGGPFDKKFQERGCYEHYASGDGIARFTRELLDEDLHYSGILRNQTKETLTAHHVFAAYDMDDALAVKVIEECIEFWGMASANLISIFNPQKIIFGGGVFGPAIKFIPRILSEAKKWAQPVSAAKVRFEKSALDGNAAIYGAGFLAMKNLGGT